MTSISGEERLCLLGIFKLKGLSNEAYNVEAYGDFSACCLLQ